MIDTGVDFRHPDLMGNLWVNSKELTGQPHVDDDMNGRVDDVHGYDFYQMDGEPLEEPDPDPTVPNRGFHGTHVAGTVGARPNGAGVVGVCHEVKIMAIRFLGPDGGDSGDAALAIDYAVKNGAKVINASWGGYGYTTSELIEEAIGRAREKGILFVAAAGNDAHDNDDDFTHFPSSSGLDNVIAVMASDEGDRRPVPAVNGWGSNFGKKRVHLAAPGDLIWSTNPDNGFAQLSGTSMATPHVTGAVALLHGHPKFAGITDPVAKMKAIREAVLDKVRPVPELSNACQKGGVLDLTFMTPAGP